MPRRSDEFRVSLVRGLTESRNLLDARDKYANDRGSQLDTHSTPAEYKRRAASVRYGSAGKIVDRWSVSFSKWNSLSFSSNAVEMLLRIRGTGGLNRRCRSLCLLSAISAAIKIGYFSCRCRLSRFHEKRSNRDATGWP